MHVNITTTLTERYSELRNTFSQATAAYGKGKVSTKYMPKVLIATFGWSRHVKR